MILYDCRESELANFRNMLPSGVCKKKWCLFTACSCKGLSFCTWRHPASLRKAQQCPILALLCRHDNQRWTFVWGRKLALYVSGFNSPLWKYSTEDIFPPAVRECLWMDALPSLFSEFWVCDTCTFSKQINSASLENIIVHFLNSCGR